MGTNFWIQFWPQLAATFCGAIFGILGAFLVHKLIEILTERANKKKILSALRKSLGENKDGLEKWTKEIICGESAQLSFVNDELWRTFADGGELEWIKDPNLMKVLSDAHFAIRQSNSASEIFLTLLLYSNVNKQFDKTEVIEQLKGLEGMVEGAIKFVDEAIEQVDKNLK